MPDFDYPYVRDEVVFDQTIQGVYDAYQGPGAFVLLARTVRLDADVKVNRWPLIIVADVFDGNGRLIDARGVDGTGTARPGKNGAWAGYVSGGAKDGWPAGPGGSGTSGESGQNGTHGFPVTLLCREGRNVQIKTSGGSGTDGAPGGNGAIGSNGFYREGWTEIVYPDPFDTTVFQEIFHDPVDIPGTSGGSGGYGGNGGNAGNAGAITYIRISDVGAPVLECRGGKAGWGAAAGTKAPPGDRGEDLATDGEPGAHGTEGSDGVLTNELVNDDESFGRLIRPTIGDNFSNHWAPFRIGMGDFFYRKHNAPLEPAVPAGGRDFAADAAREFARGLELQPDNAEGLRLQAQLAGFPRVIAGTDRVIWVGGDKNALGLPRRLDLLPQFETYQSASNAATIQLLQFFAIGVDAIIQSQNSERLLALARQNVAEAGAMRDDAAGEIPISESEKTYAEKDVDFLRKQLEQTRIDIEAALAEMEEEDFGIGDVFGTVAQIGVAVVGVIAAIPTGGASLVGLVPALVSLSSAVIDGAAPVVQAVLDGAKADTKAIDDAYAKVEKKAAAVIKSGKAIIDFIKLVDKISEGSTPDNSKHVALVKQGAALTHEVLMADHRLTLADQRLKAAKARLAGVEAVLGLAEQAEREARLEPEQIRAIGLAAIGVARSRSVIAARFTFRAQRSVEIYTLKDQSKNVRLDAGTISPETDRQYYDGQIKEPELVRRLLPSLEALLDPMKMQEDYFEYFSKHHDQDILRLSFREGPELSALKDRHRFTFRIDPSDVPADHFDAKIRSVRLAIVGATHPNREISCEIRHGGVYEQRRQDGEVAAQVLEPRIATRPAKLEQLAPDDGLGEDPPLTAPRSLAFWGRGIGGTWELSIPDDQSNLGKLDLSGASWIQVWIGYQFLR